MRVVVELFGDLRRYGAEGVAEVEAPDGASVSAIVELLGMRSGEVWLAGVDGAMVPQDHVVRSGERVVLIPPAGGG